MVEVRFLFVLLRPIWALMTGTTKETSIIYLLTIKSYAYGKDEIDVCHL